MTQLTKHVWLKALYRYGGLRDCPAVLRVGMLLYDFDNRGVGYAFPTRQTISNILGMDPNGVSKALKKLSDARAIEVVSIRCVPENDRQAIKRHSPRGKVYRLNLEWAAKVLAECQEPASSMVLSRER